MRVCDGDVASPSLLFASPLARLHFTQIVIDFLSMRLACVCPAVAERKGFFVVLTLL